MWILPAIPGFFLLRSRRRIQPDAPGERKLNDRWPFTRTSPANTILALIGDRTDIAQ
jgi:hypothetical protein